EGFACYSAAIVGADSGPMGLPLHYHLVWLLSVGVKSSLVDLWQRGDHSPELYDVAWSFADFVARQFGQDRYFSFYRSKRKDLAGRVAATLDVTLPRLEREWHDYARSRVKLDPSRIGRFDREAGVLCSRAAWLQRNGKAGAKKRA